MQAAPTHPHSGLMQLDCHKNSGSRTFQPRSVNIIFRLVAVWNCLPLHRYGGQKIIRPRYKGNQ
eukprot:7721572-Karenia_brevis.AAC.1